MASTSDIAKRYFAAINAHDLDAATALWEPGGIDRFVGQQELVAPAGINDYFSGLFAAFPDFAIEVIELTTYRDRTAVRWHLTGTFAGPASYQGFAPNGARIELEGCDVIRIKDEKIVHNDAYLDTGALAVQLGFLPATGSPAQQRLAKLANLGTRMKARLHGDEPPELIADGVWLVRGGFPLKIMNVYLIQDGDGVALFDAGISAMTQSVAMAAASLGGVTRIVLGHADCDHRGTAPGLGAPVYCHELEVEAARSPLPLRSYWDLTKLAPHTRPVFAKLLPAWDGGAVDVAGTLREGDEVAGFRVIELPGHAPGLIGLMRDSDKLALVSDCFYTLDPQTARKGEARVAHAAFNHDTLQARRSIAKLAELEPAVVWAGHADPVTGDVRAQLERAAASRPLMGRRSRQRQHREREAFEAPTSDYPDADGNVLTLRGALSPATRSEYTATLQGGLNREDAWQRAIELLFERLAVAWTIAGVRTERQKELLARYRMATAAERTFVRDALREHLAANFPELDAP